tara:strand:- start:347 stop:595 length:249 start_codon:yes stop_codon:yes gene_type:complete
LPKHTPTLGYYIVILLKNGNFESDSVFLIHYVKKICLKSADFKSQINIFRISQGLFGQLRYILQLRLLDYAGVGFKYPTLGD